jgi:hypothetical protein
MLLGRARASGDGKEASSDSPNSKKGRYSITRRVKAEETVSTKSARKGLATIKRRNRKSKLAELEYRKSSISWEQVRGAQETDRTSRRNTERLAVMFNCRECDESPNRAHYLTQVGFVFRGYVMLCEHCLRVEWLPGLYREAELLSKDVRYLGAQAAYTRLLSRKSLLRKLLATVMDMRGLQGVSKEHKRILIVTLIKQAESLDATSSNILSGEEDE